MVLPKNYTQLTRFNPYLSKNPVLAVITGKGVNLKHPFFGIYPTLAISVILFLRDIWILTSIRDFRTTSTVRLFRATSAVRHNRATRVIHLLFGTLHS